MPELLKKSPPSSADSPKRRRFPRWLRWLGVLFALAGVAVVTLAVVAYLHVSEIALWALDRALPGLDFKIEKIHSITLTGFDIEAAAVSPGTSEDESVSITRIQAEYDWQSLTQRRVTSLEIGESKIVIGDAFLNVLEEMRSRPASADPAAPWVIEKLGVQDGVIELRPTDAPPLKFGFHWQPAGERGDGAANLIRLTDLIIGDGEDALRFAHVEVEVDFAELAEQRIRAFHIRDADLPLSPEVFGRLEALAKRFTVAPEELDAATASAAPMAWYAGRVMIENGRLSAQDLPSQGDSVEGTVDVEFNAFQWPPVSEAGGDGTLTLADVTFSRDGIEAAFREAKVEITSEGLAAGIVDSVEILEPTVKVSPTAPKEAAGPSTPATLPDLDWSIAALRVQDGAVALHGFAAPIPEMNFRWSADWKNVGLGEAVTNTHELVLENLNAAPAFDTANPVITGSAAVVEFSVQGLLQTHVDAVRLEGFDLVVGRAFRTMLGITTDEEPEPSKSGPAWNIGHFDTGALRIRMEDIGFGVPDLAFQLRSTIEALTLTPEAIADSSTLQTVELSDIVIHSPLDPYTPVLNLASTFVKFRLADLVQNQIEEITFLHPTLYVGEDLFWYVDEARRRQAETAAEPADAAAGPPWRIKKLYAAFGRLAIATAGASRVALPLNFQTEAENISFTNLSDLQLQFDVVIPREDYAFPGYRLELNGLEGNLRFGLPSGTGASNVVNTLQSNNVRWRQFEAESAWISVTYDRSGIYSEFGSSVYGGYVQGGFAFFIRDGFPWTGWMFGSDVNLESLTDIVAPQNFSMTGQSNFKLEVNATSSVIERVAGTLESTGGGGKLYISKFNDILEAMPGEWGTIRRDLTRIALETLRDFEYNSANADFWFVDKHGRIDLQLAGDTGSRNFEIIVHDAKALDLGRWQRAPGLTLEATRQ